MGDRLHDVAVRAAPPSPAGKPPEPPFVAGASVRGPLHHQVGLPCQDAFRYRILGKRLAIAVADGLGSAARADAGARAAAGAAVTSAAEALSASEPPALDSAALAAMRAARKRLEEAAAADDTELRAYACTLMTVVVDGNRVCAAHVGDGGVVTGAGGELQLLSDPGLSEYVNEVEPLTSDGWESAIRVSAIVDGVETVALFTDGCQRAGLRRSAATLEPHPGFFGPLFAHARSGRRLSKTRRDLRRLLAGAKMSEHSEDDKTLAIAILDLAAPARRAFSG